MALMASTPKRMMAEAAMALLGMLTNIASNFRMEPPTIITIPVVTVTQRLPPRLARTIARLLGYGVEENEPSAAAATAVTDCPTGSRCPEPVDHGHVGEAGHESRARRGTGTC